MSAASFPQPDRGFPPPPPLVATGYPAGCQICDRDVADGTELCSECREVAEDVVLLAGVCDLFPQDEVTLDVLFADRTPDEMRRLAGVISVRHHRPPVGRDSRCLADLIRIVRERGEL